MATFRKLQTAFWTDPFVEDLTQEQKLFYLYLITNTKTSQSGIYEITKKYIAYQTGFSPAQVNELLSFFERTDKISYSAETNEIAIINWSKFNYNKSHKVLKCIYDDLQLIKSTDLIKKIYDEVYIQKLVDEESKYTVLIEYLYSMHTVCIPKLQQEQEQEYSMHTVCIPKLQQEQEQEQEQEQVQEEVEVEVEVQQQVELQVQVQEQVKYKTDFVNYTNEPPFEGGSSTGWSASSKNKLNELITQHA